MERIYNAISSLKQYLDPLETELVNLQFATNRIVAQDVKAKTKAPCTNICNINGYAFNANDIENLPTTLKVIGKSTPDRVFSTNIDKGEAIQVFSGTPLPHGANIVAQFNNINISKNITINDHLIEGQNISPAGIDFESGDIILKKGTLLTPKHIALATIADLSWVPVVKSPRVALINNIDINQTTECMEFSKSQCKNIFAINNFLESFIFNKSCNLTNFGHSLKMNASGSEILAYKKDVKNIINVSDMIIIVGGLNLIQENLLWSIISQYDATLQQIDLFVNHNEKIIIGHVKGKAIIGIPDHYVTSLISTNLILHTLFAEMHNAKFSKLFAKLDRDLDQLDKQNDYLYANLNNIAGENIVTPTSAQDSLMISVLANSNCIIVVDKQRELKANSLVEIITFEN